jgi:HK97 family phage major capsid protein
MATNPVSLSSASPLLLPPTITSPIFNKAAEQSAVMRLARRVPLSVNATTQIPVPMDIPTAGWVSEGAAKPVATGGVGVKTMTGKKVALLVPVSEEVVRSNAAGLYDQLVQDLPTAISRAFDYAAIHGKDLKSGGNGPFGDYLTMTPNAQVIGSTAANAGGVYADLWKGIQQVENIPGYEFTGFAADRRLRSEAALSVDTQGRPLLVDAYPSANNAAGLTESLVGLPIAYNSGVSGSYIRAGDAVQTVTHRRLPDRWHVHHLRRWRWHFGARLQRGCCDGSDGGPGDPRWCRRDRVRFGWWPLHHHVPAVRGSGVG